eukprot:TRINITY_DN5784_c0_g2_i2.p1 TRINITY_DN5784_c0_g2~~TRINITY_DN5784_c0_g2_i2.p1  ORF type:complete len:529 (+),score=109.42 TRINITY_DN5784_c0_g2_i2:384-1970(+)
MSPNVASTILLGLSRLVAAGVVRGLDMEAEVGDRVPRQGAEQLLEGAPEDAAVVHPLLHCVLLECALQRPAEERLFTAVATLRWANGARALFDETDPDQVEHWDALSVAALFDCMGMCDVREDRLLAAASDQLRRLSVYDVNSTALSGFYTLTPGRVVDVAWGAAVVGGEREVFDLCGDMLSRLRTDKRDRTYERFPKSSKINAMHRADVVYSMREFRSELSMVRPSEVARAIWAFATARVKHIPFLQAAIAETVAEFQNFAARDLAVISWGLGRLGYYSPEFMILHADRSMELIDEFTAVELAFLLWGYVSLARDPVFVPPRKVFEAAMRRIESDPGTFQELSQEQCSQMLWALGQVLGAEAAAAVKAAEPALLSQGEWSQEDAARVVAAATAAGAPAPAALVEVAGPPPSNTLSLETLSKSQRKRVLRHRLRVQQKADKLATVQEPEIDADIGHVPIVGSFEESATKPAGKGAELPAIEYRPPKKYTPLDMIKPETRRKAQPWYLGPAKAWLPRNGALDVSPQAYI